MNDTSHVNEKLHERLMCQGQRSPAIKLSLGIMPINNILKFENDCSTNREVIDQKPIFSEKLHEKSLYVSRSKVKFCRASNSAFVLCL